MSFQIHQQSAAQLLDRAKKCLEKKGFLWRLWNGRKDDKESACALFLQAAYSFQLAKLFSDAGSAFVEAAILHLESNDKYNAATCYKNGGNCYVKSVNVVQAIECYEEATSLYTELGSFSSAAKLHSTIGNIYEKQARDIEKGICHYEKAVEIYALEGNYSPHNEFTQNLAKCYALYREDYVKASQIFEENATACIESSLLIYNAKNFFFRAALCHMCFDLLNGEFAVQRYEHWCPNFGDSRECRLLKTLLRNIDDRDPEGFEETIVRYEAVSRLDSLCAELLARVKKMSFKKKKEDPNIC